MNTPSLSKQIILTAALAGLALLAADMTELRAEPRVARIAAAAQESQKFESLLSARIARQSDPARSPRAPRPLLHLRAWVAQLRLPTPLLAPLAELQRARLETKLPGIDNAHPRRGRILDKQRYPSEPE